jgi:hypothetical protein
VEDLRATDHSGGRREDYEIELKEVDEKITEKKALLDVTRVGGPACFGDHRKEEA